MPKRGKDKLAMGPWGATGREKWQWCFWKTEDQRPACMRVHVGLCACVSTCFRDGRVLSGHLDGISGKEPVGDGPCAG